MHHDDCGQDRWPEMPTPRRDDAPRHGERLARLEVVAEHLTERQRATSARINHHGEAMSRIFSRLDRAERAMHPIREDLARVRDLPARFAAQEADARRRREEKHAGRMLRREAIAMVQWLLTIVLAIAVAAGWVAPEALHAISPVLVPGK